MHCRNSKKARLRVIQLARASFAAFPLTIASASADEPELASQESATLEVRITGFDSPEGRLAVALFATSADYETQENAVQRAWLDIDSAGTVWTAANLSPGEYAVIVYQDVNGNEQIDLRILGMPKEPVGVSNNARGFFGPPRFRSAKFEVTGPVTRHEIELR